MSSPGGAEIKASATPAAKPANPMKNRALSLNSSARQPLAAATSTKGPFRTDYDVDHDTQSEN